MKVFSRRCLLNKSCRLPENDFPFFADGNEMPRYLEPDERFFTAAQIFADVQGAFRIGRPVIEAVQDKSRYPDRWQEFLGTLNEVKHLIDTHERHAAIRLVDSWRHVAKLAPRLGYKSVQAGLARRQQGNTAFLGYINGC